MILSVALAASCLEEWLAFGELLLKVAMAIESAAELSPLGLPATPLQEETRFESQHRWALAIQTENDYSTLLQ